MMMRVLALAVLTTNVYATTHDLKWDPHPESDSIQGFKAYCGNEPGRYNVEVYVTDPSATDYPVAKLVSADGEYYCALTAYNASGESEHSGEVHFTMRDGAVVTGGDPIIVDNLSTHTGRTGTWLVSTGPNPWATGSLYSDSGSKFRWNLPIPSAGPYQVYAWWTYHTNRSTTVPYRVRHASGTSTVVVNQRNSALAGQWISLGTYELAASGSYVEVSSENGQASADAIKLVPAESGAEGSEVVVDNRSAATARSGSWYVSTGKNPWSSDSVYNNGLGKFRWTPTLTKSGSYKVYAWWTYHSNRSTNVPYSVRHAAGTATVSVNQRDSSKAGRWVLLGSFKLDPSTAYVEVFSENGQASADAVRFVPMF